MTRLVNENCRKLGLFLLKDPDRIDFGEGLSLPSNLAQISPRAPGPNFQVVRHPNSPSDHLLR